MAVNLSTSNETKAEAYHLQGGILKDLGEMDKAEKVRNRETVVQDHVTATGVKCTSSL